MKLGIMQPYFMPYLGYWQLLKAVDRFVVLDNVGFIKQGYINRNSILSGSKSFPINIQVQGISSNKLILEHQLNANPIWKKKLLKTISQNYSKAPYFSDAFNLVDKIIDNDELNLSKFLSYQLNIIAEYLNLDTEIVPSATIYNTGNLMAEERVIEICKQTNSTHYFNAFGGKELYKKENFYSKKIKLQFLKMGEIKYSQFGKEFVPFLSIIDLIMFNSPEEINIMLDNYELV